MKRSALREILKLLDRPGMISFAGGLPAPETFPVDDIKEIVAEVLENEGKYSLQYSTTEGDPLLRKLLVERYNLDSTKLTTDNLVITTGSQQALDIIGKIFIDPGDYIICGLPSYLGGINAFLTYGARMKGIRLDRDGLRPDELEKTVSTLRALDRKVKFIYIIPDFQNPAGITVPESRRLDIIEIAQMYNLLIIEDSPYREIRFEGEQQRLMFDLDSYGRVITLGTFSKIFAPGFRVGWVMGQPAIIDKIVMAKQTADLCTSAFVQRILARYMEKGLLEKNVAKTVALYRERRDHMISCLKKYMPGKVTWTEPQGGLFIFLTLPERIDTDNILRKAIERNVAFVSGATFFCNDSGHNTMRINYSYSSVQEMETGIERLSSVIKEELR